MSSFRRPPALSLYLALGLFCGLLAPGCGRTALEPGLDGGRPAQVPGDDAGADREDAGGAFLDAARDVGLTDVGADAAGRLPDAAGGTSLDATSGGPDALPASDGGVDGGAPAGRLIGLAVTPSLLAGNVGAPLSASAIAFYADGRRADVTNQARWGVAPANLAILVRGSGPCLSGGDGTFTASFEGLQATGVMRCRAVGMVVPRGLVVTPRDVVQRPASLLTFSASLVMSDGSTRDVTEQASWSSSDPRVAFVFTGGNAITIRAGTTTVSATQSGFTGEARLIVR